MFVFGDCNVPHKDWLTYSGGADRTVELCYNLLRRLTFLLRFQIPDWDSQSPALLDLFISSDASICSAIAFSAVGNSDHAVSVSIDFPSNAQQDALFHHIAYDYSHAHWDSLCDHLRDVP